MIEPETAEPAEEPISMSIASLVEAEHFDMVSPCRPEEAEAKAERLRELGMDIAQLARALAVMLRRSRRETGAC